MNKWEKGKSSQQKLQQTAFYENEPLGGQGEARNGSTTRERVDWKKERHSTNPMSQRLNPVLVTQEKNKKLNQKNWEKGGDSCYRLTWQKARTRRQGKSMGLDKFSAQREGGVYFTEGKKHQKKIETLRKKKKNWKVC